MFRFLILILLASAGTVQAQNLRIVDGDTLVLDRIKYRINGIDAPEAGQTCKTAKGTDWACGEAATKTLIRLTRNRRIRCEKLATDPYNRIVARCYAGKLDLGRAMVVQGMAWAFLKFSDEYEADQQQAKTAKLGIWQGTAQAAWDYRARKWQVSTQKAPAGCPIKGNISSNGKIYHTPWSKWYARTHINTAKGERWFCDEAEAIAAGWRAAK